MRTKYTYQELSDSGSFRNPEGRDVHYAYNLSELRWALEQWGETHEALGADKAYATIRVWCGNLGDVTDVYPDFDLRYGPRGGVERVNA